MPIITLHDTERSETTTIEVDGFVDIGGRVGVICPTTGRAFVMRPDDRTAFDLLVL
jgi:hypothetical protein